MNTKYRSKKFMIISLLIVVSLVLPMVTFLPDMAQSADIPTDSSSLVIKQMVEDGLEIAVNWGSRPMSPPIQIGSLGDVDNQDGTEVAVNWASSAAVRIPLS